ncbi:hypothetical protein GOBAR_DD05839 [Gossypium barbadense]|nr:hypothetical protein GOBAR_DD05839 [Gossypium barbadense]
MGNKLTMGKRARAKKGFRKYQQGIARALKPMHHKAQWGLGFEPDIRQRRKQLLKNQERRIARASGQDNPRSVLFLIEKGLQNISINVVDNESDAIEDVSIICPFPLGYVLNNWIAIDLLVVSKFSPECSDINGMNNLVTSPEIDF